MLLLFTVIALHFTVVYCDGSAFSCLHFPVIALHFPVIVRNFLMVSRKQEISQEKSTSLPGLTVSWQNFSVLSDFFFFLASFILFCFLYSLLCFVYSLLCFLTKTALFMFHVLIGCRFIVLLVKEEEKLQASWACPGRVQSCWRSQLLPPPNLLIAILQCRLFVSGELLDQLIPGSVQPGNTRSLCKIKHEKHGAHKQWVVFWSVILPDMSYRCSAMNIHDF